MAAAKPQGRFHFEHHPAKIYLWPLDSPRATQDVRASAIHEVYKGSDYEDDIQAIAEILALTSIAKH